MRNNVDLVEIAAEVAQTLTDSGVDVTLWGQPGTKSIEDLAREVADGDCELVEADGGLLRCLRVLRLDVFYDPDTGDRLHLKEDRQEYANGGPARRRGLTSSLGEKMRVGEVLGEEIVLRALKEELGIETPVDVDISLFSYEEELATSRSFPGLPTHYDNYLLPVTLPDEAYDPNGYIEVQPGRKTTYFVWEPA